MDRHRSIVSPSWWLFVSVFILGTFSSPIVPRLETGCYSQEGDLYLGNLIRVTAKGQPGGHMCSQNLRSVYRVQYVEAFVHAIHEVNKRQDILPNVTLGFIVLDTCGLDLAALAQATHFLPDDTPGPRRVLTTNCSNGPPEVPVTGVVGPATSREAVLVASLLSAFQIPLIATTATSDELSDKSRFEYFLRLVPPDKFQIEAMLDLVAHFNWTYVSMLYSEGSYGENAAKAVIRGAKTLGLCLPVTDILSSDISADGMTFHIDRLVKHSEARAVILLLQRDKLQLLFDGITARKLQGQFVWISGDSMGNTDFGPPADGAFVMYTVIAKVPGFVEEYLKLTPVNNGQNPWMRRHWEMLYGCTWDTHTDDMSATSCYKYIDSPKYDQPLASYLSYYIDGVYAYAYALHDMISELCPDAFLDQSLLKTCINGPTLLRYLRALSFRAAGGDVTRFDANGDMLGRFSVRQYQHNQPDIIPEVAFWDHEQATFEVFQEKIKWDSFKSASFDLVMTSDQNVIPESICAKPCGEDEYVIQRELPCCWDCRRCRSNERVNDNKTGCDLCPLLTWPDDVTASECHPIPAVFLRFDDAASLAMTSLTTLGIAASLATSGWYVQHWKNKLIKASSRELTCILLTGALLAYTTVFAFLSQPNDVTCALSRYGFSLAVSLIYAPLLVKTNRIYRIFSSGKRGTKKPTLIGNRAQVVISFGMIIIQVVTSIASSIPAPPEALQRMPIRTEKMVELYCSLPLIGLLPPLSFNILLVLLCAIFGFLTRKLPENFNESWYIFVSVSTTMFLWLVFLPTYFTAFYASHQVVLLASCLLINASVTLICLFVPKMYAVHFMDEEQLKLATTGTTGPGTETGPGTVSTNDQTGQPATAQN